MALFFVVVFAAGMYVVMPLGAAWAIWRLLDIQNRHFRVLILIACVAITIDYWQRAQTHSPPVRPSASAPGGGVAATGQKAVPSQH